MPAAMSAVATVAEHMHRDKPAEEQHPNPVLCKPFHDRYSTQSIYRLALSLVNIVSRLLHALHRILLFKCTLLA